MWAFATSSTTGTWLATGCCLPCWRRTQLRREAAAPAGGATSMTRRCWSCSSSCDARTSRRSWNTWSPIPSASPRRGGWARPGSSQGSSCGTRRTSRGRRRREGKEEQDQGREEVERSPSSVCFRLAFFAARCYRKEQLEPGERGHRRLPACAVQARGGLFGRRRRQRRRRRRRRREQLRLKRRRQRRGEQALPRLRRERQRPAAPLAPPRRERHGRGRGGLLRARRRRWR